MSEKEQIMLLNGRVRSDLPQLATDLLRWIAEKDSGSARVSARIQLLADSLTQIAPTARIPLVESAIKLAAPRATATMPPQEAP